MEKRSTILYVWSINWIIFRYISRFYSNLYQEKENNNLKINNEFSARLNKHPLVSFINQVEKDATDADLCSTALFNKATGFNTNITMRDLISTYVYENTLVKLKITGKILKQYLEK